MAIKTKKDAFSDRFNAFMSENNLGIHAIAYKTGISAGTLKTYHEGKCAPTMTNLRKLVLGTGKSADWWIGVKK